MTEKELRLEALKLCMETGERYMECLNVILQEYIKMNPIEFFTEWMCHFRVDYEEYDKKMRKAGRK